MELRGVGDPGLARPVILFPVGLLLLTALRLVVAAAMPLTPDEAYYWIWSRTLAGGYYDHPPMVALWIFFGTFIGGDSPLGVRLLAPLSAALGSLLLVQTGKILTGDRRLGILAAILLNATLALGIGAVTMTPDTPLILFWTATLWALARLLASGEPGKGSGAWFLLVGLFAGLALASKYTAVFLGVGIILWLLAVPTLRGWLWRPWPWLGGLLAVAIFAPVIAWNASHEWAGFAKQGGRAAGFRPAHAAQFLAELVGGQIGLMTPLIFFLSCAGIAVALRAAWRRRDPAAILLVALTLPALLVFLQHTLAERVQANWPVILYPSAILAATMASGKIFRSLRPAAIVLGFGLTALVYIQATLALLPIPQKLDPSMKRLAGWTEFSKTVEHTRAAEGASFVAADNYGIAAELAFFLPPETAVIGVHPRWRFFALPYPDLTAQRGILVRSTRLGENFDTSAWENLTEIGTARRTRNGVTAEEFRLYRVTGRGIDPTRKLLPHPATAWAR